MKKKILSFILCLCLLLGLAPGLALGAAEEATGCTETFGCSLESGHAGECVLYETRYWADENGTWAYGTLTEACANVYAGGRVEVLRDIDPSVPVEIRTPLIITSADPGKPCKIVYTSGSQHDPFLLTTYSNVLLEHIILDGGRLEGRTTHTELVGVKAGQVTLGAGAVLQNNDNVDTADGGGGVRAIDGTAVMAEGSVIRNCRATVGGGVVVTSDSTLVMNGGTIEDCEAFAGGGVYVKEGGKFLIQNSSLIEGCAARKELPGMTYGHSAPAGCGGGIFLQDCSAMMMKNSTLTANTAELDGGGMYVFAAVIQLMSGEMTDNRAERYGGGIMASPLARIMVGGSPRITGNTSGEQYFDNMCLEGREDGDTDSTWPLYVAAPLTGSASIGVSRLVQPDSDHLYRVVAVPYRYTITEQDLAKFHSDDPNYACLLKGGSVVLTMADVVFDTQGHGDTPPGQHIDEAHGHKVERPTPPTADGYTFVDWYKDENCTEGQEWNFDTDEVINLDVAKPLLTLYAKWNVIPYDIVYDLNDDDGGSSAENGENPITYNVESATFTLNAPRRAGYIFLGWTWEGQNEPRQDVEIPTGSLGDRTFTAHWEEKPQPPAPLEPPTPPAPPELSDAYLVCPKDSTCPIWPYTDSRTTAWYHDGVHYCIENGLMIGYGNGTFGPEKDLTRAELAQILYNREGRPAVTGGSPFTDVPENTWYAKAVIWAAQQGVVMGYGDGRFGPNDAITREQLAAMLYRYEQKRGSGGFTGEWMFLLDFADREEVSGWAYEAMCWMTMNRVIQGKGNKILDPRGYAARAEAAAMVQRYDLQAGD